MRTIIARGLAVLAVASTLFACSSADPGQEPSGTAAEAICGNGRQPGCGTPYSDPNSPTGCSETCWTCLDSYTKHVTCPPPPCGGPFQHCCDPGGAATCDSGSTCHGGTEGIPFHTTDDSRCIPDDSYGRIAIRYATYGENCNVNLLGNASDSIALDCDNTNSCTYTVDYHVLGDPAPGCAKNFHVDYWCTNGKYFSPDKEVMLDPEAGFGSIATLSCP